MATGVHINQTLANHGAATHAAKKAGDRISNALPHTFPVTTTAGAGNVIDQIQG